MRDGATSRFFTGEGRITSQRATESESTSYIECCRGRTSRKDIEEFACGSRSTRSVFRPRIASAAARLMAVVVFPTPPFWFAMAMAITRAPQRGCGKDRARILEEGPAGGQEQKLLG